MIARIALVGLLTTTPVLSNVQEFFPLHVGNSWTFFHTYGDERAEDWEDWIVSRTGYEVTISILRTEVVNGNTYYVFSGMPPEDPYAPPRYFFADKKIRWSGNDLMVLNEAGTSEYAVLRFDRPPKPGSEYIVHTYAIDPANAHGDTLVHRAAWRKHIDFRIEGPPIPGPYHRSFSHGRNVEFLFGYGPSSSSGTVIEDSDVIVYANSMPSKRATLYESSSGETRSGSETGRFVEVDHYEAVVDWEDEGDSATNTPAPSWGRVKRGER